MTALLQRRPAAWWLAPLGALLAATAFAAGTSGRASVQGDWFTPAMVLLAGGSVAWLALQIDLAWTFSGVIALSVFSGQWSHLGFPVGADRLALALGLAVLAWRAWHGQLPVAADRAPHVRATAWLLTVATAYAVVSAAWAGTLGQHDGFYGLLDRLGIVPFLLFLAAPIVFGTERQRAILLGVLVALGAYLGVTALLEGLGLDALVFPRYIVDPNVGIHIDRARGPFVEAVANGLGLFACLVAAALAVTQWRGSAARAVAAAVVVLCAVGIVLTLTRAVWIAGAVAPIVAMAWSAPLRRWLVPIVLVGGLLTFGALDVVPGLQGKADSRTTDERPVWDRLNTDHAALRMVGQRPLLGFGWNSFVVRGTDELRQDASFPITGAGLVVHNVFLSNAVELGLVGFAVWFAAFVLGIGVTAARRAPPPLEPWRIGLVALAVDYVIVANLGPLGYAFPTLLLWTWAGVVAQRPRAVVA
jgi:putative inorganic carbon (HCO3(-)) transporter